MSDQDARKTEIMLKLKEMIDQKMNPAKAELFYKFIEGYYKAVATDELEKRDPVDLYGAALCHWELINSRKPGECKIRIYNPNFEQHGWQSTHTIVEVAQEDMPFLVDSIRMAIVRMGFDTHLMVHVGGMKLRRDAQFKVTEVFPLYAETADGVVPEAPIHIEMDRQTDMAVMDELKKKIEAALDDVKSAVEDWPKMQAKMRQVIKQLGQLSSTTPSEDLNETREFLEWLEDNHFTYLGYRYYRVSEKQGEKGLDPDAKTGLGVLREISSKIVFRPFSTLSSVAQKLAMSKSYLIISKTNTKSTVHRDSYTDYIGIKVFDEKGNLAGEHRFIGLYTSTVFTGSTKYMPFARLKAARIMQNANLSQTGHAAKALFNIIETYPREDLLQASVEELTPIMIGILSLQERKVIRMFAWADVFHRFVSCLVYVPRERFDTDLAYAMQEVLRKELNALEISFTTWFSESVLARVHYILRLDPNVPYTPDYEQIQNKLIDVSRTWKDDLRLHLIEHYGEDHGVPYFLKYQNAFPAGYRESFDSRYAVYDVQHLEALSEHQPINMSFYRPLDEPEGFLRFKLFAAENAIPLSDVMPIFKNMGLRVLGERPYKIRRSDGRVFSISDFSMSYPAALQVDIDAIKDNFQEAFLKIWEQMAENDSFNHLVLSASMSWREVRVLRVYAKYLRQTEFNYSQPYMEDCLKKYPAIARLLVELFLNKFDPHMKNREEKILKLDESIKQYIEQVSTLDEDKILRTFHRMIHATLRTNYFQTLSDGAPKPYLSLKLDPAQIPVLPLPLPMYEIFVCSPRFEGVHLRNSKVARGGIRWSDRPEDFRTEILGLMKAQNVKNSVIVPSGAKGGFVPKRLPVEGTREVILAEAIECYKSFIRGLLDVTDNLKGKDALPPKNLVRFDDDDPYLVVAADKGTATFSDIANQISAEYDFWLGDAFASGGSAGYDHKKMGITARGAWESVKRHFRMLNHDTQTQDFTMVGIGDMSGDVFGNGALLSRHIKLIAAFDHRHIFLDPNPEPEKSFIERERLFNLPRSSWADYDAKLISKGGGVFARSVKSIKLTPEVKAALAIDSDVIEPNDLVKAILKAPADLLFNGGIGTFVKHSKQSHASVGDRTNDVIRINGNELRCKVVGEGGNLGFTQLGRIEYELNGGHIYTDFIDNSAGVDCSDHEVNIKILLNQVVRDGDMTLKNRDQFLAEMTDEVARLVLQDNYRQTLALRLAAYQAFDQIDVHGRFIQELSRQGLLNRNLEFLPDDQSLIERKAIGKGLTLPEMAVLFSYCKIIIKKAILASELPEDPYLSMVVVYAFPKAMRERYRANMNQHPLKREIIATIISNALVNEMGFTFVYELQSELGVTITEIVRAYAITRSIFKIPELHESIFELDTQVPAQTQLELLLSLARIARSATRWLLKNHRIEMSTISETNQFQQHIFNLVDSLDLLISEDRLKSHKKARQNLMQQKVPENLAKIIAGENELLYVLDVIEASRTHAFNVLDVAKIYYSLANELELFWLREQIRLYPSDNQWDAFAKSALYDDLASQQRNIAITILKSGIEFSTLEEKYSAWCTCHAGHLQRWHTMLANLKATGVFSFTMMTVSIRALADLAQLSEQLICTLPIKELTVPKAKEKEKK